MMESWDFDDRSAKALAFMSLIPGPKGGLQRGTKRVLAVDLRVLSDRRSSGKQSLNIYSMLCPRRCFPRRRLTQLLRR